MKLKNPPDFEFLGWVAARMVLVYGESPNVDFVLRLREMAAEASTREQDEALAAAETNLRNQGIPT